MQSRNQRARLNNSRYFDYSKESKRWTCNICSLLSQGDGMTTREALRHEETTEHRENARAREEWGYIPVDANGWNRVDDHIDQIRDFIPFWRRTIEAAEYGETLRFEDFLNALHRPGGKKENGDGWDLPMPEWAMEPMMPIDDEQRSAEKEHGQPEFNPDIDHDAFNFVETIANMDSLDAERKKRLHSFYKMPTTEKVKRIYELINALRTADRAL